MTDSANRASVPLEDVYTPYRADTEVAIKAEHLVMPMLTDVGHQQLLTGISAARVGHDDHAGEAVWEMTEDDVQAGLAILHTMTQALIAQGTNFQLGRHIAAEARGEGPTRPTPATDRKPETFVRLLEEDTHEDAHEDADEDADQEPIDPYAAV